MENDALGYVFNYKEQASNGASKSAPTVELLLENSPIIVLRGHVRRKIHSNLIR